MKRRCFRCQETKPLDDFVKSVSKPLGRDYLCRECGKIRDRVRYAANRAAMREKARARGKVGRKPRGAYARITGAERMARDPIKETARRKLRWAVRSGALIKPSDCDGCLRVFPPSRLHGHHTDYSKPLSVEWLCHDCHGLRHRRESD